MCAARGIAATPRRLLPQRLDPGAPLALLLQRVSRWLDALLLAELERQGWPRLSPSQSLVFAYLDHDGTSPAELARRMGSSRQATAQLIDGLVELGLLSVADDERRRRGRLVRLSVRGRELAVAAAQVHRDLEHRLGDDRVESLRSALAELPWDLTMVAPAEGGTLIATSTNTQPDTAPATQDAG